MSSKERQQKYNQGCSCDVKATTPSLLHFANLIYSENYMCRFKNKIEVPPEIFEIQWHFSYFDHQMGIL